MRVVLVAGGEWDAELVRALNSAGARVHVVGPTPLTNGLGEQPFTAVNPADASALARVLLAQAPDLVMAAGPAASAGLRAYMEESSAAVCPPPNALDLTHDSAAMQRIATEELDLQAPRCGFATTLNRLKMVIDGTIGYPCVIKSLQRRHGVEPRTVRTPEEVEPAWSQVGVGDDGVMVEGWLDFDFEATQLVVRAAEAGTMTFCEPVGHRRLGPGRVEVWHPQALTRGAAAAVRRAAGRVAERLDVSGVCAVRFFIKGDQIWFNGARPNPHLNGLVTLLSQGQNQFDLHARAVLGLPVSVALARPAAGVLALRGYTAPPDDGSGADEDVYRLVACTGFDGPAVDVALATGDSLEDARRRARQVGGSARH